MCTDPQGVYIWMVVPRGECFDLMRFGMVIRRLYARQD